MDAPLRVDLRELLGRGALPPIMGGADPDPNDPPETVPKKDHDDLLERFKRREKAFTKLQGEAKTTRTDLESVLAALGVEELPEDPDERAKAIERVIADRKGGGKVVPQDEVQRLLESERKKFAKDLEGRDQRIASLTASTRRHMIENATMAAALEAQATDAGAEAIAMRIASEADLIEEDGELKAVVKGKDGPRLNSKGEHLTIKERVAEIAADEKYASWFRASGKTGGGTPPADKVGAGRNGQMRITRAQLSDAEFYRKNREDIDKARREGRLEVVGA